MFDLSLLPDGGLGWLDASGDQADVVLSTRVRLARNVEGYAFTGRSREGERLRILAQVRDAAAGVPSLSGGVLLRVDELDSDDRRLLHERHVISRELAGLEASSGARGGAAVYVGDGVGVMVNEEDHLRLQSVRSGFALEPAFAAISRLDEELGRRVPYSFHKEFGFLTACPTNTGTGMRASVLIHLPALVLTSAPAAPLAPLALWPLGFLYGAAVVPAPGGGGAVEMAFRAALGSAIPPSLFAAALSAAGSAPSALVRLRAIARPAPMATAKVSKQTQIRIKRCWW